MGDSTLGGETLRRDLNDRTPELQVYTRRAFNESDQDQRGNVPRTKSKTLTNDAENPGNSSPIPISSASQNPLSNLDIPIAHRKGVR